MKTKCSSVCALASLLVLVVSADAIAQGITSLTSTAKGRGTVTIGEIDKLQINSVLVILKENGEAQITLYADLQLSGEGTWSIDEDLSRGIDLKITGGIVSGNATGSGKLFLRPDGKSIARLRIDAVSAGASKVKIEFKAKATKDKP